MNRSIRLQALVLVPAVLLAVVLPAVAGPPLICHPLEIGDAESLPGAPTGWQAWKAPYDTRHLLRDTCRLLGPDTPVIVRMETIRRAVLHTRNDPAALRELGEFFQRRADPASRKDGPEALSLFDYGYFVGVFHQFRWILEDEAPPKIEESAYALVTRAIELRGGDSEMELAAALLSVEPRRESLDDHIRNAASGAEPGSLLAINVLQQFRWRADRIPELRRLEARASSRKL